MGEVMGMQQSVTVEVVRHNPVSQIPDSTIYGVLFVLMCVVIAAVFIVLGVRRRFGRG